MFLIPSVLFTVAQEDTVNTIVVEANQEAELAYNKGISLMGEKQYKEAVAQFEEALKYNAQFRQAYVNMGSAK